MSIRVHEETKTDVVERCPACASDAKHLIRRSVFGPSDLVACSACRTQLLSPQPTDARLAEIYGAEYYQPWAVEDADVVDAIKRLTFAPMLEACAPRPGRSVLDLGCATGSFLGEAARQGAETYGVDLNPGAIKLACARVPEGRFHTGVLADAPFPGVRFDAVVMIDFLEHVRDPADELKVVRERMGPDSRLVVSTPRVDSTLQRVMGRHWPQYREEHLTYLSRDGVRSLLARCGFTVERITATRKVLTLAYAYGQAVSYPVPVLSQVTAAGYRLLRPFRHRPVRVGLGEMTVVAHRSD